MTGEMPTENLDGMWKYYPSSKDVIKAVGLLQMIVHYIGDCQKTIACFNVD
jgi:hypothetical protein